MKEYSIFLLEPENLLREVLLNVLEDKGYPVYSFANSWETLSFIKKIKFQIAVIDSDLEISSRDRIISEINSLYPAASIIILTLKISSYSKSVKEPVVHFVYHSIPIKM